MKNILINLLFHLLGNSNTRLYNIQYLFGASTANHETRKKRWERALARLYRDKDLLDYLYYQAESDKENVFRGKIRPDLARGARIRTLFIINSAHRAYLNAISHNKHAEEKSSAQEEVRSVDKVYKQLVDIP